MQEETIENIEESEVQIGDLANRYIDKSVGTVLEIEIDKIRKIEVTNPNDVKRDYCLSGVDYYFEVDTMDGKILGIGAWKLWNAVRKALDNAGEIHGQRLKISHPEKGMYEVALLEKKKKK